MQNHLITENEFSELEIQIKNEILEAIDFAEQGQLELINDLCNHVYSPKIH